MRVRLISSLLFLVSCAVSNHIGLTTKVYLKEADLFEKPVLAGVRKYREHEKPNLMGVSEYKEYNKFKVYTKPKSIVNKVKREEVNEYKSTENKTFSEDIDPVIYQHLEIGETVNAINKKHPEQKTIKSIKFRNLNEISYPDKLEILHEDTKAGNDAITQNDSKVKSFDSDNSYDEFPEYTTPSYDLASTPVINLNCSGCKYFENSSYICSSEIVEEIPDSIPDFITAIIFQKTNITEIPNFALAGNMATFILFEDNKALINVHANSFKGLENLQYFYFRNNDNVKNWEYDENDGAIFSLFSGSSRLIHLVLEDSNLTTLASRDSEKVLPHLEYLSLAFNSLRVLRNNSFSALSSSPLKYLNLQNCQIRSIEQGTFENLPFLEHADFHFNPDLFMPSFETPFFTPFAVIADSISNTIQSIGFGNNGIVFVPTYSLTYMKDSLVRVNLANNLFPQIGSTLGNSTFPVMSNLTELILDNCGIITVADGIFTNLVALEFLSLKNNPLVQLYPALLIPSLHSLHIQVNSPESACFFTFPGGIFQSRNMSNLRDLRLESVNLESLNHEHLLGLRQLETLSLTGSSIIEIENLVFSGLTNLRNLSLAYCTSDTPITWSTLQGPNKLLYLDLTHATFSIENMSHIKEFTSYRKIEVLNLTGILSAVDNPVDLSFVSSFKNLKILEIGCNKIRSWEISLFPSTPKLEMLTLQKNGINLILTEAMLSDFFNSSLVELDLSENLFECNQLISKFYKKAQNTHVHIVGYLNGSGYVCADQDKVKTFFDFVTNGPALEEGVPLNIKEGFSLTLQIITTTLISLAVSFAVCLATYKYRWYIRYHYLCYLKTRSPVSQYPEYIYDAFISYSKDNEVWVLQTLVPFLEETEPRLKLCIHERDFKVGSTIVENIINCVDSSRKIVLVLTKSYVNSSWCMFEAHMAQHRILDGKDRLIMIKLQDLDKSFSKSFKHILSSVTYLPLYEESPPPTLPPFQSYAPSSVNLKPGLQSSASNWHKLKVTLLSSEDNNYKHKQERILFPKIQ